MLEVRRSIGWRVKRIVGVRCNEPTDNTRPPVDSVRHPSAYHQGGAGSKSEPVVGVRRWPTAPVLLAAAVGYLLDTVLACATGHCEALLVEKSYWKAFIHSQVHIDGNGGIKSVDN